MPSPEMKRAPQSSEPAVVPKAIATEEKEIAGIKVSTTNLPLDSVGFKVGADGRSVEFKINGENITARNGTESFNLMKNKDGSITLELKDKPKDGEVLTQMITFNPDGTSTPVQESKQAIGSNTKTSGDVKSIDDQIKALEEKKSELLKEKNETYEADLLARRNEILHAIPGKEKWSVGEPGGELIVRGLETVGIYNAKGKWVSDIRYDQELTRMTDEFFSDAVSKLPKK